MQEGMISLPKWCTRWNGWPPFGGIAVGLGEKVAAIQTTP